MASCESVPQPQPSSPSCDSRPAFAPRAGGSATTEAGFGLPVGARRLPAGLTGVGVGSARFDVAPATGTFGAAGIAGGFPLSGVATVAPFAASAGVGAVTALAIGVLGGGKLGLTAGAGTPSSFAAPGT